MRGTGRVSRCVIGVRRGLAYTEHATRPLPGGPPQPTPDVTKRVLHSPW